LVPPPQVLHQVQNDALATEQHAGVVANHGHHLAGVDAHAIEHFRVADDLKAGLRRGTGVEMGEDFKQARHRTQAADHQFLPGHDGGGGAQVGVDGQVGGGVAGGLVFKKRLLQQCVDTGAFPVHGEVVSSQWSVVSGQ